jgi:protein SCO1/2
VKRRAWLLAGIVALLLGAGTAAFAFVRARTSTPPLTGDALDRAVPSIPLIDQNGRTVTLASFRGRVVVLAPTLTLCSEVCPVTAGAFIRMEHAVRAAGLSSRVAFVEVTVDPERDTPARLLAYRKLTGADWPILTGSPADVRRFWSFFGVGYFKQPEPNPPGRDWLTGRPLTYDVAHQDGLFFVDAGGHDRIVIVGPPTTGGRLAPQLERLLSNEGFRNLAHPRGAWTVRQALDDLSRLVGRPVHG